MAPCMRATPELRESNERLRNGLEELKAQTKELTEKLTEELTDVKAQLAEARTQWADIAATVNTLSQFGSPAGGSGTSRDGSSPQTYASVLTNSINPSSSASQPTSKTTSSVGRPRAMLPGVTLDTWQMKDKSKMETDRIPDTEKLIKEVIQAIETIKEIQIAGIPVRGQHVRVLTSTEKEAALLRTHNRWVNEVFEGARTRGEDWHPIKIDDVVKAAVVKKDGHTIKDDFAQTFCAENGVTGVMKAFWLSKCDKAAGSMAVFLASADEARRMMENRLAKIGGQIAFVGKVQKVARSIRSEAMGAYCANVKVVAD